MKRTPVLLLVMLVVSGIPLNALSQEWFPGDLPTLGDRPDGWWMGFPRDENGNGIDDLLDRAYLNGTGTFEDVLIGLDRLPVSGDVDRLEGRGVSVRYAARSLKIIAVGPVRARDLPDLVGLDGTVLIEVPPTLEFALEYAVPSMRARDSTEYSPYTAWDLGYDGTGVNIAVMDSGVNDQIPTGHTMVDDMDDDPLTYDPKFIAGADASSGVLVGGVAVNPEEGDLVHGTHVAGDALGTGTTHQGSAPGSRLIDIRVGALTNLNLAGVLAAMDWCMENNETDWESDGAGNDGVPIVSMSFGGAASNGNDEMSQALNDMVEVGIVAVVAAGNNGPNNDGLSTPGSADRSINIASYDDHDTIDRGDDTLSGFSARGPRASDGDSDPYDEMKPHVAAPGSGIQSALAWSGAILVAMDGTSMATPEVSGVIALMLEANPNLRPTPPMYEEKIKILLGDTAQPRGTADRPQYSEKWNIGWGYGQIDAYGAVKRAADLTGTVVTSPGEVDSGTRRVPFGARIPVTRTPYTIEDDETRLVMTIPTDWGRPEDIEVTSTGDVDFDAEVNGPSASGGLWTVEAYVNHTEDIDRYQECMVSLSFTSRAPGVDVLTDYSVEFDAWTNGVMANTVEHIITVEPVPNIIYSAHSVDDDNLGSSHGNGDGVVNPGETIELGVEARNVGTRTAMGVTGTIGTDSPYVTVTDDVESFGNIAPGGTAWSLGDYDLEVDDSAPVGANVTFDVQFIDMASHMWNDSFAFSIGGTEHDIAVIGIDMPERAEAGDIVPVTGTLRNLGMRDESSIEVALELNGTVLDSASIGLDSGETGEVDLEWTPDSSGDYVLWVNATPVNGEDAVDNNAMNGTIAVFSEKGVVLVDDVNGDVSEMGDFLDALADDGYDIVNASDEGTDLAAMLTSSWAVLAAPGTLDAGQAAAYSDFVRLGGGLLLMADGDPGSYEALTGPMGLNWSTSPATQDDVTDDIGGHPVTDGVGSVYLRSPAASLGIEDGTELVASSNGAVVGAALGYGEGRAVVVSDDDLLMDASVSREDNLVLGMNAAGWLGRAPAAKDIGIAMLSAPAIVRPNGTFEVSLSVINVGTDDADDIGVELRYAGETASQNVSQLGPGDWANLTFDVEFDRQGRFRVSTATDLTDDAPDNERSWREVDAFEGDGAIAIVTYHGNLSDHGDLFRYLSDLGFTFEEVDSELGYGDTADLDAVFLLDPDNLEDEEISALEDTVRSGRGLLVIGDDETAGGLIGGGMGISWGSWPGEEGVTEHIASNAFTGDVASLYVRRPYAQVGGPFLFGDYDNGTHQGANVTFGEGRFIATSDIGLLADDTLWEEDNARFARQAVAFLCRPRAREDGALVGLDYAPFGERDVEHFFRATVHNLGSDRAAFNVSLEVDGDEEDTATVVLDEGELGEVELSFTPPLNGTYDFTVALDPLAREGRTANNALDGTFEALMIILEDDCDSDSGWTEESLWHITDRRSRSGTDSWWYGDEATGDYSTGSGDAALWRTFSLDSVRDAGFGFRYFLDAGAGDRAEVNLSADGGANWTTLAALGGLEDRWNALWLDLSAYEDEEIAIAFRFVHDASGHGEGLFVEDVWLVGRANVSVVLEIEEPAPDAYLSGERELLVHARDPDGIDEVEWRLDGGAWADMTLEEGSSGDGRWSATVDTEAYADGDHGIEVRSTNATGYQRFASVDVTFDNTPPDVSIDAPTEGKRVAGDVDVEATADDATSGVDRVEYRVGSGGWTEMDDGSATWDSRGTPDGKVAVQVRATDRAGNRRTTSVNVTVDNTPPSIDITAPSQDEEVKGTIDVIADITDATGAESVKFAVDGGGLRAMTLASGNKKDGTWDAEWDTTDTDDGDRMVSVRAVDELGNEAVETVDVHINNVDDPPTIRILEPEEATIVSATVGLVANASDDESVERVRYRVAGGNWVDLTKDDEHWTGDWDSNEVEDGVRKLEFRAWDEANQYAFATVNVTVDNTAPLLDIIGPTGFVREVITLEVDVTDVHLDTVEYRIDNGEWAPMEPDHPHTAVVNTSALPDGTHTVRIRAQDLARNVNTTSWSLTSDNTWPEVSILSPGDEDVVQGTVTVHGTIDEENLDTAEFRAGEGDWVDVQMDGEEFESDWDSTDISDGEITLYVRAQDKAGNGDYRSIDVFVDNVDEKPTLEILEPEGGLYGLEVEVRARATDDRGIDKVAFRPEDAGWIDMTPIGNDTYRLVWNSSGYHGDVEFVIAATDSGDNIVQRAGSTEVDTAPPAIDDVEPEPGTAFEDTITLSVRVQDENLEGVRVRLPSGWEAMNANGGRWECDWTPGADGNHTVIFKATDSLGNAGRLTAHFIRDTTDPTVKIILPSGVLTGRVLIQADVTDLSLETIGYAIDGVGYYAMEFAGGQRWTARWDSASVSDGTHTVSVRAVDAMDRSKETSGNVRTNNDNDPPVVSITDPDPDTYSGTVPLACDVDDDFGVEEVHWSVDGSTWHAMDKVPKEMSWTGQMDTSDHPDGALVVQMRATDVNGTTNTSSVEIETDNTAPAVRVTSPKRNVVVSGEVTVRATAEDPNLLEVEADLGSGWEAMTGDGNGAWTALWDSTVEPDGEVTISVRAEDVFGHDTIVTVAVEVDNVNQRPTISVDSPSSGKVSGFFEIVAVVDDDRGIKRVNYELGNMSVDIEADEPNVYTGIVDSTAFEDGIYSLRVRAADTDDLASSQTIVIEIDNEIDPVHGVSIATEGKVSDRSRGEMTFDVKVTNSGNVRTTFALDADYPSGIGVFFSKDAVQLDPGDEEVVTITVVPLQAGMYTIRVTIAGEGVSDDVTLQVVVPEKGEDDDDMTSVALAGLLVAVIVLFAAAWYMGWLPSSARSRKP